MSQYKRVQEESAKLDNDPNYEFDENDWTLFEQVMQYRAAKAIIRINKNKPKGDPTFWRKLRKK